MQATIISVANQKGGVGKTTSTVNLARALVEAGKRVLVIDSDPQSSLSIVHGLDPRRLRELDATGKTLNTYGTKLNASRNLRLEAGDAINYYAVYDQQDVTDTTYQKKSFWGLVTWDRNTTVNSTSKLSGQPTQLQSLGDILSNSGGNQLLQGTKVSYGGSAAFNAGVGEKARSDARIILEGIKNSTTQVRTQEANYIVWQKQVNQGTSAETLVLPSFTGPTKPTFTAPGGLSVQIAEGDFKSQINTLGAQPGMGYLNDLAARQDVNWQPVKLAFEQWNYKQEGLTPAGAALLAAAVAWAMPVQHRQTQALGRSGARQR